MSASGTPSEAPPRGPWRIAVRLIATGLGTGYAPWASGTFGSLAGMAILLVPGAARAPVTALLIAAGFIVGVYVAARVAAEEGNRLTRSAAAAKALFQGDAEHPPDPSIVVIDEIVGVWIALAGIPPSALPWAAAFLLFRLFDVLKPQPARALERLPGGWGIMLDDVVAGIYANAAVRALLLAGVLPGPAGG